MAVTLDEIIVSLRLNPPVDEGLLTELQRRLGVAVSLVNRYAPDAPSAIRDEAVILIVGYLHDRPSAPQHGFAYVFRSSGAEPLLAPWRAPNLGGANVVVGPTGQASPFVAARVDGHEIVLVAADGTAVHLDLPVTTTGALPPADRTALDGAVQRSSVAVSDRDLTFADAEGNTGSVRLPGLPISDDGRFAGDASTLVFSGAGVTVSAAGDVLTITISGAATNHLTVKDDGVLIGTANTVDELDIRGEGVTVARAGNTVTLTITPPATDPATLATILAAVGRIGQVEQFENAMRRQSPILTAGRVTIAVSNAAARLPNTPKIPADDGDRELLVKVGTGITHRFDVSALHAKPAVNQSAQLTDANSISWRDGDDTFRIAREGNGNFLFTCDTGATYAVTITDSQIDLQRDARLSAPKTIRTLIADAIAAIPAPTAPPAPSGGGMASATDIQPAALRFDAGTRVGNRAVFINEGGTGFKGVTLAGLQELYSGNLSGLSITSTGRDSTTNIELIGQFDLDDHSNGELHLEVQITLSGIGGNSQAATTVSLGWDWDLPQQVTTWRTTDLVFISTLKNSDVFVLGGTVEGVKVAEVEVLYPSGTEARPTHAVFGTVAVYLVRNSDNRLGVVWEYRGGDQTSHTGFYFSLACRLDLSFMPSDSGAPTIPGAGSHGKGLKIATCAIAPSGSNIGGGVALSAARWTIESAFTGTAADKYQVRNGSTLWIPQSLPGTQVGFFVEVKVSGSVVSSFFVASSPAPAPATGAIVGANAQDPYWVGIPRDGATSRAIKMVVLRQLVSGRKDAIYFVGAGKDPGPNVTVELYEWLA